MGLKSLGACALAVSCVLTTAAFAQSADSVALPPASAKCDIHVYGAEGVHSVGEDLDAVHRVDQDLHHYYEMAGRPLNWLTPERQLKIIDGIAIESLMGLSNGARVDHQDALTRRQAIDAAAPAPSSGCQVQVMLPQIMLERGGLASRSLRIFGVVRRFEDGALTHGYSGYAAAPMAGFSLKTPADAEGATAIVEAAYRAAVETLLFNSAKTRN